MRRVVATAGVALLCLTSGTPAAATPTSAGTSLMEGAPWTRIDASGPLGDAAQALADARLGQRRAAVDTTSVDVGDVAVIVDDGTIVTPARPENLVDLVPPVALEFSPTPVGFAVERAPALLPPVIGPALPLSDDDSHELALPFSFPFLGQEYSSVFVNSDGNLTFGSPDTDTSARDAARLIAGSPRIAPFLRDLNPDAGGAVRAEVQSNRLVVAWEGVPEYGVEGANTFRVTLTATGAIRFAYERLDTPFAVIGIAEGGGEGPINEIDLTSDRRASYPAGAIFEEFSPRLSLPFFNSNQAARAFYRSHEDRYDFLVFFADVPVDLGGGGNFWAYNRTVHNTTQGLGRPLFDFSASVGSAGELESIVAMNNIHLYWPTAQRMLDPPIQDGPGLRVRLIGTDDGLFGRNFGVLNVGLNSPMSVMAHEAGHRWLAFTPFVHPQTGVGPDSNDLLDRQLAHWSFFHNTEVPANQFDGEPRASSVQGNAIRDLGPAGGPCAVPGQTRFRADPEELVDGFTPLDQYMMGLRTAGSVEPFWYVDQPTTISGGQPIDGLAGLLAISGATFCGKRVDLDLDDIRDHPRVGPRVPALGDEDDTGTGVDVKTMAFVLVTDGPPGGDRNQDAIQQVDRFRATWQSYANGPATGGLGRFDTVLDPGVD